MVEFDKSMLNVCKIRVVGVGGAGNNAVNRMIDAGVSCADFYAVNTDLQALMLSKVDPENRIQIGQDTTKGLGAGSYPEIGEQAAEEDRETLKGLVKGINLLFITCGMGGGTGTGAAPVIAKLAREEGCVIVAVVSKPFSYEGKKREENAKKGIANLSKYVDTMIVIPNDKILEALPKNTSLVDALKFADENLRQAICGISDLIAVPGLINLDFADVKAVISNQGVAHMGFGRAKGESKIVEAVRQAVSSPMLETTVKGASKILLNITGDVKISMGEVYQANDLIKSVINPNSNFIFGVNIDEKLDDEVTITIIATGFNETYPTMQPVEKIEAQSNPFEALKPQEQVEEKQEDVQDIVQEEPIEEQKHSKEIPPFVRKIFKIK